MIGFFDQPPIWQAAIIAVDLAVFALIVLNAIWIVPPVWRAGLAQMRVWLTPDHPKVVSIEERRRLHGAALGRRP